MAQSLTAPQREGACGVLFPSREIEPPDPAKIFHIDEIFQEPFHHLVRIRRVAENALGFPNGQSGRLKGVLDAWITASKDSGPSWFLFPVISTSCCAWQSRHSAPSGVSTGNPRLAKVSTRTASSVQSACHSAEVSRRSSTCVCPSIS